MIAIHEAGKVAASQHKVRRILGALTDGQEAEQPPRLHEQEIQDRIETADLVHQAVTQLPEEKRKVIELYYYEQYSYAEIAQKLNIPIGTVMSRLYHAKKLLKTELHKQEKDGASLWSIGIFPLLAALFASQSEATVPTAIKEGILTAIRSKSASFSCVESGASGAAGATTMSAAGATASTVGASVAVKITAAALAATVAIGGSTAAIQKVKRKQVPDTPVSSTVEMQPETTSTLAETVITASQALPTLQTMEQITTVHLTSKTTAEMRMIAVQPTATTQLITAAQPTASETQRGFDRNTVSRTTTPRPTTVADTKAAAKTTTKAEPEPKETTENATTTGIDAMLSVSDGVLKDYTGSGGAVKIPSSVNGEKVTAIGVGAFSGSGVTSVTVPSGVQRIGQESFSDCTALEKVSLPSSLNSIGAGAFFGCTALSSVTIPTGTTTIGDDAFADCAALKSVSIPASVTSIGDGAFNNCPNVTLRCEEGSAAQTYAEENELHYNLI